MQERCGDSQAHGLRPHCCRARARDSHVLSTAAESVPELPSTCGVPECVADSKGKLKRTYKRYATPCELVCELAGVTFTANHSVDSLQRQARACSDTEAAAAMQQAKRKLFTMFQPRRTA